MARIAIFAYIVAMAEPKWKRFEKLIHQLHSQFAPEGAEVIQDDKIVGCESKVERQLDVTIRHTIAQYRILLVIECKDESRPIDVATMGEFASLLRDVKANKGVMVSTSGFTPAAIAMASAQGIDTRTFLDTENTDWKSEVTIPVLLIRAKLDGWSFTFASSPDIDPALWGMPTNIHPNLIPTYDLDGTPLGPIITVLGRRWNHDESLHEPGEHKIVLSSHILLGAGDQRFHVKLEARLKVSRHHYLGPLPIQMTGFRNDHDGSLTTNKLTTDFIEPGRIERGEADGWRELPSDKELAIEAMLVMNYSDSLPESAEELKDHMV